MLGDTILLIPSSRSWRQEDKDSKSRFGFIVQDQHGLHKTITQKFKLKSIKIKVKLSNKNLLKQYFKIYKCPNTIGGIVLWSEIKIYS